MGLLAKVWLWSFGLMIMATPPPLTERIIVRNFLSNCWVEGNFAERSVGAINKTPAERHAPMKEKPRRRRR